MIDYIEIAGFKSIRKMELELKPINILIGSNGSGKSNFISFFKLINAIFNGRLQQYVIEEKADDILYFGRKTTNALKGKITFTNIDIEKNGRFYDFTLTQNKQGGLFIEYEAVNITNFNDNINENYKLAYNNIEESKLAKDKSKLATILQDLIFTLKIFHFHDTSNTSVLRKECDINDNLYLKPDGRNLPAILYLIKEKHPKIFTRIEKTIQSIAPYIDKFILEPQRLNTKDIELRWVDKGDPESSFSTYQLSDGTLRFIALATLLMQPEPPSVIIIDEPELGLHPFAIGKLAGMIQSASTKAQIIVATQSPGLISHFSPEDVVVIDKSIEENQTIFKRLSSESLNIWLEEYSLGDLWERNIINSAQPFNK